MALFYKKKQNIYVWEDEVDCRKDILICLCIFIFGLSLGLVVAKIGSRKSIPSRTCQSCHNTQQAMTDYFKKAGSKQPEQMASAVLRTKHPKLLAAVAVVESGGNPSVKRTGYKKHHSGAFQVNPKYWGQVPEDATGQALQAERILDELLDKKPLKHALSAYAGDSSKRQKYANNILAELQNVPN